MGAPLRENALGPNIFFLRLAGDRACTQAIPGARQPDDAATAERLKMTRHSGNVFRDVGFPPEEAQNLRRNLSYAETLRAARAVGQALIDRGLSAKRPLVILLAMES